MAVAGKPESERSEEAVTVVRVSADTVERTGMKTRQAPRTKNLIQM